MPVEYPDFYEVDVDDTTGSVGTGQEMPADTSRTDEE